MNEPAISLGDLLIVLFVGRILALAIVTLDERRMSPERLERAWPVASKGSAILQFGELALPIHFLRTRRNIAGIALAVGVTYAVLKVEEVALMVTGNPFPSFP